jgi:hypothetical protein
VKGTDGLSRLRWTDEPPEPTTFTLMLLRAVAEANAGARNTAKVKTAAAAVDSVSATGTDPPTPGTARGSSHPMISQNQRVPLTAEPKAPLCASGEAEPPAADRPHPPGRT